MSLIRDLLSRKIEGFDLSLGGVRQSAKLSIFTPRKVEDPQVTEIYGKVTLSKELTGEGGLLTLDAREARTTTFSIIINPRPNQPTQNEDNLDDLE